MNVNVKSAAISSPLRKLDPASPALKVTGPAAIAVKAGTVFGDRTFEQDTPLTIDVPLEVGGDYAVTVIAGALGYAQLKAIPAGDDILGGFHFAPGGNATARSGGDSTPAINPCSLWDANFRPVCDPRGMVLVEKPGGKFWCDIYLLGTDHLLGGTSKLGVRIADGDDTPINPDGGESFERFDYATAVAVMRHHGKGLLSVEEFFAAAFGVTEKTARDKDPKKTGLDAPRTSKFGIMQATGNLWVWGHDGDPDQPRASLFGGSWFSGDVAGSRYAGVACYWPGNSSGSLGARGRGDHLQLD